MTAGGKNVAPAVLEDRLRAHPLVSQCLVVGDGQPFIAALVTLDPEAFPAWAEAHGKSARIADLVDDPDLRAEIEAAVEDANKAVSKAESIRKFTILPDDWTEEGGQLTPEPQAQAQRRDARVPRRDRRPSTSAEPCCGMTPQNPPKIGERAPTVLSAGCRCSSGG